MKSALKIHSKPVVFAAVLLALFGILMQYSASSYSALRETGDAFFYVKKQALALVAALAIMAGVKFLDTAKLKKWRWALLSFSCVLLALVFVPGLGVEKYGATRWINLGFTTLQPSEIAKFALAIFVAAELSDKSALTFGSMAVILVATLVVAALIMLEPNMSITMCVALVVFVMLIAGGLKFKHFAALALPVAVAVVALILLEPYRLKRMMAFLDPWASPLGEGYQLIQSYYALGAGGLFGLGLFNSRQKYLFLPFAESDFIFAVIGEELGWFGCLFVLFLFLVIIVGGIRIAMHAENRFDCYLATGVVAIIAVQTALNVAVVTGSIPPTGLPLPFVSAGGSSLLVFMAGVALLENVSARSQRCMLAHSI